MIQSEETFKVDLPVPPLREAILDFDSYSNFLPEINVCRVLERKGDVTKVHFETSLGKKIEYALEFDHAEEHEISWELIRGDVLKRNSGYWKFTPLSDGKTHVTYRLELQVGFLVPEFLVRQFVEANLRKTVDRFISEAEKRSR